MYWKHTVTSKLNNKKSLLQQHHKWTDSYVLISLIIYLSHSPQPTFRLVKFLYWHTIPLAYLLTYGTRMKRVWYEKHTRMIRERYAYNTRTIRVSYENDICMIRKGYAYHTQNYVNKYASGTVYVNISPCWFLSPLKFPIINNSQCIHLPWSTTSTSDISPRLVTRGIPWLHEL